MEGFAVFLVFMFGMGLGTCVAHEIGKQNFRIAGCEIACKDHKNVRFVDSEACLCNDSKVFEQHLKDLYHD